VIGLSFFKKRGAFKPRGLGFSLGPFLVQGKVTLKLERIWRNINSKGPFLKLGIKRIRLIKRAFF